MSFTNLLILDKLGIRVKPVSILPNLWYKEKVACDKFELSPLVHMAVINLTR
jgi:hypothetical protein